MNKNNHNQILKSKFRNRKLPILTSHNIELAVNLGKIFNQNKTEILFSISLFKRTDSITNNILHSLAKMNKTQKISAHLSLEYLLLCGETAGHLMNKKD